MYFCIVCWCDVEYWILYTKCDLQRSTYSLWHHQALHTLRSLCGESLWGHKCQLCIPLDLGSHLQHDMTVGNSWRILQTIHRRITAYVLQSIFNRLCLYSLLQLFSLNFPVTKIVLRSDHVILWCSRTLLICQIGGSSTHTVAIAYKNRIRRHRWSNLIVLNSTCELCQIWYDSVVEKL